MTLKSIMRTTTDCIEKAMVLAIIKPTLTVNAKTVSNRQWIYGNPKLAQLSTREFLICSVRLLEKALQEEKAYDEIVREEQLPSMLMAFSSLFGPTDVSRKLKPMRKEMKRMQVWILLGRGGSLEKIQQIVPSHRPYRLRANWEWTYNRQQICLFAKRRENYPQLWSWNSWANRSKPKQP